MKGGARMRGKRLRLVTSTDQSGVLTDSGSRAPVLHAVCDPAPRSLGSACPSDDGSEPDDAA